MSAASSSIELVKVIHHLAHASEKACTLYASIRARSLTAFNKRSGNCFRPADCRIVKKIAGIEPAW